MKALIKKVVAIAVLVAGFLMLTGSSANAQWYEPQWHDTSHFDYHPGQFQQHGNHFHYVPGHHDWHETGHFHGHPHN